MGFTMPASFQLLGPNDDETGASQISAFRGIGGNETADGLDEATALLRNSHYLWDVNNLAQVTELTTWGVASPQASFYSTTSASYVEFATPLVYVGADRNIVLKVQYVGRVKAELYDVATDTLQSSAESADSATVTVSDISLSASNETEIYLKIYLKKGSAATGYIYSASALEGGSGISTNATYGFKKIDDDAANGEQPFDAFLGQGIASNIEASYKNRLRRAGTFWPVGNRPVMASAQLVGFCLGTWRVSLGADQLKIRMNVTTSDGLVKIGAEIYDFYDIGGLDLYSTDFNNAGIGDSIRSLTLDVSEYRGREIVLFLYIQSLDSTATPQTKAYTAGALNPLVLADTNKIDLQSGHGMTLNNTERYKVQVSDPTGSNIPTWPAFPDTKTVVYVDGDDLYVWPRFDRPQHNPTVNKWYKNDYTVTVTKIGRMEVKSIHIEESRVASRESLAKRYHPGHLPSASFVGKPTYMKQRRLFMGRTRCHRTIGGFDPARKTGSDSTTHWGSFEPYKDSGWITMGSTVIRGYDSSLSSAGVAQYRSRLKIVGILQCVSDHLRVINNGFKVKARVVAKSWGGSSWNADTVASDELEMDVPGIFSWSQRPEWTLSGDIINYKRGTNRGAYHHLNGAFAITDLVGGDNGPRRGDNNHVPTGGHGMQPFEIDFTDTQTASTQRILLLQFHGSNEDSLGHGTFEALDPGTNWMRLVTWGVWTHEGVS